MITELSLKNFKAFEQDRVKIQILLEIFAKGRIVDEKDTKDVENWIITNIGVPVPILEIAAKHKAVALTIPTEPEWRCDILHFENRSEILHNLWGQQNVANIVKHGVDLLENVAETRYGPLLELRIYGSGHRIFFVYRKDIFPKVLVEGFYQKNQSISQKTAIVNAQRRINEYQIHGDVQR